MKIFYACLAILLLLESGSHVTSTPPAPFPTGFLCPVHTPDGAPCGLLNHLAAACCVTTATPNTTHLPRLLTSLGMIPLGGPCPSDSTHLPVLLDGRLIGEVEADKAKELAAKLRTLKTLGQEKVSGILLHTCTQCWLKVDVKFRNFIFHNQSRIV